MFSVIVFGFTLMAGCVFAGAFFRRDFADSLPLSVMGLILVLYLAGFLGALKAGVFLILGLALVLWILSAVRLRKEKSAKRFLKNHFGAEGVYFIVIYIILVALNVGRLAWHHDELSHWMTCVKAMTNIDDFAANYALSDADFASYPPAMALFQYFFQKLHEIFDGAALFSEWRPYAAFQLFCCTLFFPAVKRLKFHKLWKPVLLVALLLIPLALYPDFFAAVLIDPVLGVMAGAAFMVLFFCEDIPLAEKTVHISMLCALLVLMKDAGIFFAVFAAAAFAASVLMGLRKSSTPQGKKPRTAAPLRSALIAAIPLLSALAAKGSWKLVLNRFATPLSFSAPLRLGEYLKIFFAGGDATWRGETVQLYKAALTNPGIYKIHEGITTSYLLVLLLLLAAFAVFTVLRARKSDSPGKTVLLSVVLALQTVVYTFFLGAVYISKFSEIEAAELACFDRYVRIGILPLFLVLAVLVLQPLKNKWKVPISALLCAGVVLLCSFEWLWGFVSRSSVQDTVANRAPYRAVQETVETECSGHDEILLPDDLTIYERNMLRYLARPNKTAGVTPAACDWKVDRGAQAPVDPALNADQGSASAGPLFEMNRKP